MSKLKDTVKTGLILLGAGAAASMLGGAVFNAAYNKISYEFVDAQFKFNQLLQGRVGVDIRIKIKNGNSVGVTVTHVEGEVKYGNLKLSDVNLPLPIQIPANGETIGTINLSIQAMTFVSDIIAAFQPGSNVYNTLVNRLKFKGIIYTNIVNIPIDINIPVVVG